MLISRNLKSILIEDAQTMRVLLVNGARQTGKSTLMKGLFEAGDRPAYVTLDDLTFACRGSVGSEIFC